MTLGYGTLLYGSNPYILHPSNISSVPVGATTQSAFLAATGLTFTRPAGNGVTVQTSASTRDDGISGAADIPLIGNAGYGRGLVIEGSSANYAALYVTSTRDCTSTGWTAQGGMAVSYINAVNSLGVNAAGNYDYSHAAAINVSQNLLFTSGAGGILGSGFLFCSSWQSSRLVGGIAQATAFGAFYGNAAPPFGITTSTPTGVQPWTATGGKFQDAAATDFIIPIDYGSVSATVDILLDAMQVDTMGFRLEYKPGVGAGAARTADSVRAVGGATLSAASGRLSVWLQFIPKGGTAADETPPVANCTSYTICTFLNGFVRINLTSKKVEIQTNGGAVATSTNAIVWALGDVVEFFVAVGNGLASVLKYRRNGGAWVDLAMATTFAAVATTGDLYLFSSGAALESMWCWAQNSATYKPGHAPAGV